MTSKQALSHLKVVDASDTVAGQFCGRMLSDFGADTVLLEPQDGTPTRNMEPFSQKDGKSFTFFHLNHGKRIESDGNDRQGRLLELTADADIAILPAGVDHAALRQANPQLVTCTVSDFGEDGPRRNWKGGELIMQALSGIMYRNGDPARDPLYGCGRRAYYVTGVAAYSGVLAAIYGRKRIGKGQHVAIDAAECAASMTFALATQYHYGTPEKRGTRASLPSGELQCKDGWVTFHLNDRSWRDAFHALGLPEIGDDERFRAADVRMKHWSDIVAKMQQQVADMPSREVVDRLQGARSTAGIAAIPSELFNDPHLVARNYWEHIETDAGERLMLGAPFRMEKSPRQLPGSVTSEEQKQVS